MPWTRKRASVELLGLLLEDADELLADDLALALRVVDAGEPVEEALVGVDVDQLDAELLAERLDHLLGLVLAHQPVVDEDAGELVADRAVDERRGGRRVDPAGEPADHAGVADLGADRARPARRSPTPATTRSSQPATSRRKRSRISVPYGVWTTSGWNWIP